MFTKFVVSVPNDIKSPPPTPSPTASSIAAGSGLLAARAAR
jgi:hypothetical protein